MNDRKDDLDHPVVKEDECNRCKDKREQMGRNSLDSSPERPYDEAGTSYEDQGFDQVMGEYDRVTKG